MGVVKQDLALNQKGLGGRAAGTGSCTGQDGDAPCSAEEGNGRGEGERCR